MTAPTDAAGRVPNWDRGPGEWYDVRPHGTEACARREARAPAAHALAAPIPREIARMALAALGLSGNPVHEPVHA